MKTRNNRLIVLTALLFLILTQLMCDVPLSKASISEDVLNDLSQLVGNEYGVKGQTVHYSECENYIPLESKVESFTIKGNKLIVTKDSEEVVYTWDNKSEDMFCREPQPNVKECVNDISEESYHLTVEEFLDSEEGKPCYSAFMYLEALEIEASNDTESDQQPEFEPDPDPEPEYYEPAECDAIELVDFILSSPNVTTSASDETTCEYTLTVTNIGQDNIVVFKHINQVYSNVEDDSRWEDYKRLSPGESYEWVCYQQYRNNNDTFTFYYIDAIAPIFDITGCMNTFKNNSEAKEEIKFSIPVLCDGL